MHQGRFGLDVTKGFFSKREWSGTGMDCPGLEAFKECLDVCHSFMIFGHRYSTSQHHAVYWELKSKCSSSGYLSGRKEELRSPEDCLSTVVVPAQGNRYKACRSPDLVPLRLLLILSCLFSDHLAAAPDCMQGFSISVRPLPLRQSFSQLYLVLLTIILNYIVS